MIEISTYLMSFNSTCTEILGGILETISCQMHFHTNGKFAEDISEIPFEMGATISSLYSLPVSVYRRGQFAVVYVV